MKGFFNMDSPFFVFLSRVADLMILNLLFIVCCIPVFTIGAACTALSYVTLKQAEQVDGYIVRGFFHAFKQNFKQSTLIWLIMLFMLIVLIMDFMLTGGVNALPGSANSIMRVLLYIGFAFWIMVFLYVFPLLARFENTVFGTIRNAILISFANAPKTLLMMAVIVLAIVASFWSGMTIAWSILVWFMVGFSLLSYINSLLQVKIIHRFMPEEEEEIVSDLDWRAPEPPKDVAAARTQEVTPIPGVTPVSWGTGEPAAEAAEAEEQPAEEKPAAPK